MASFCGYLVCGYLVFSVKNIWTMIYQLKNYAIELIFPCGSSTNKNGDFFRND